MRLFCIVLISFTGISQAFAARIHPEYNRVLGSMKREHLGHNSVFVRGGLGVWDEKLREVRPEVAPLLSQLRPGTIRFPGGTRAMRYRFDHAIGNQRKPQCDPFTGNWDDTSFGVDEFLRLAEKLGSNVTLVLPWAMSSSREAAAFIAYVRGDVAHLNRTGDVILGVDEQQRDWKTASYWAALRGKNGHPAPYDVVQAAEVGNEAYLGAEFGPVVTCAGDLPFRQNVRWVLNREEPTGAAEYAHQVKEVARLAHLIVPEIKIGAAALAHYFPGSNAKTVISGVDLGRGSLTPWNQVLRDHGGDFDFFVLHPYDFMFSKARSALPFYTSQAISQLREIAPSKTIAVTEYGLLRHAGTFRDALLTADMTRVAAHSDLLMNLRHILIEDNASQPFAMSAAIMGTPPKKMPSFELMIWMTESLQPIVVDSISDWMPPFADALVTRKEDSSELGIVLVRGLLPDWMDGVSVDLPPGKWEASVRTMFAPKTISPASEIKTTAQVIEAETSLKLQLPPQAIAVLHLIRKP